MERGTLKFWKQFTELSMLQQKINLIFQSHKQLWIQQMHKFLLLSIEQWVKMLHTSIRELLLVIKASLQNPRYQTIKKY